VFSLEPSGSLAQLAQDGGGHVVTPVGARAIETEKHEERRRRFHDDPPNVACFGNDAPAASLFNFQMEAGECRNFDFQALGLVLASASFIGPLSSLSELAMVHDSHPALVKRLPAVSLLAATAAAAAARKPATTASTTSTPALGPIFSLVHAKRSTVHDGAVHALDGPACLIGRSHGDEAKSAGLPTHPIEHDVDFGHLAIFSESSANRIFIGVKRQISYVDAITHDSLSRRLTGICT
jgi:hypothetical protein